MSTRPEFETAEAGARVGPKPAAHVAVAAAAPVDVFELELECQRQFGQDHYAFYKPEYAGDFQVFTWRVTTASNAAAGTNAPAGSSPRGSAHPDKIYAATIYENGDIVDFAKGSSPSDSRLPKIISLPTPLRFFSCFRPPVQEFALGRPLT